MPLAVITGASRGLGHALASALAERGWTLVVDARSATDLAVASAAWPGTGHRVLAGDVADAAHRADLAAAAAALGGADLLVNNASTLGASPLPSLADLRSEVLARVLDVNVVAPVALTAALLPQLRAKAGTVLNISSDAAVEAYATWGGYGASKAALDHVTRVLAEEEPDLRAYAVDPGDMRTQMHADAFPGEDISDRPLPETVAPALLRLLESRPSSGRYRAADLPVLDPAGGPRSGSIGSGGTGSGSIRRGA
jgi:NAD(P)-dependent dehydrogenase (short-subunit alcohol dehydrogenase family)